MNEKEADKIYEFVADKGLYEGNWFSIGVDRFINFIDSLIDTSPNTCNERVQGEALVSEDIRNHHRGTCFRVNEDYTKTLEQKLIDIECGECGKNMLECRCEEECR